MRLTYIMFLPMVFVATLLLPARTDAWEPCDPVDFVTDNWTDFYSQSTTLNGVAVPVGTCIDAVDSSGIHCGTYTVSVEGWYGLIHIYGDDATTPERDGPKQGDTIYFYIDGCPAHVVSGVPVYDGGVHPVDLACTTPDADFAGDPTEGSVELEVQFTDMSDPGTGEIVSWEWDFGDGGTSTEQNPTHIYESEGTYSVSLTVSTTPWSYCTDTELKEGYITVESADVPPAADFAADQTEGCAPLEVGFTDLSDPGTGGITDWEWDFGDGGTSSEQNPTHTYVTSGTYTVSLTVTGPVGTDSETKVDYITTHESPTAGFTREPAAGCIPLEVCFTDQSTGDVMSWEWDFGDGGTSTEQNPCHMYEAAGVYSACLVVSGPCGDDTACMDVTAEECICVADFTGEPTSGCAQIEVCFTDQSTGDVTSWEWDFGDGMTSTQQNPCHIYEMPGNYTVCLTVYCTEGDATECKENYVVVGIPPVVGFEATPTCGRAPLEVCFTDQSAGNARSWEWDFGDGGTSTEQNPCHIYETSGTYTVCLTASDAAGCEATGCEEEYITILGPWEPCDPPDFLTSTWTDFYSMNTCLDGEPVPVGACIDALDPDGVHCGSYTVQTAGSYGLMHVYGDDPTTPHCDEGAQAGDIITFYINGRVVPVTSGDPIWDEGVHEVDLGVCGIPCEADFVGEPTSGCTPLEVCFTDQSTGDVNSWEWNFGDGGMSDDQHPCHTYEAPGTYTVCLIAYCVNGSMDTECKEEYITVSAAPSAEFTGEPTEGCAPLYVCFTDQSTGDIASWEWDFGDGETSTEQNPCHTYQAEGMYTVALMVTGPCGSDTETKAEYVAVAGLLEAEFVGEPTEGCAPLEVCFTDQSTGDVTGWDWRFGDGGTSTEQHPCHIYEVEGVYTVTLIVSGPCGVNVEEKTDYVTVYGSPDAEFTGEPTEGCAPLEVCFTDQSMGDVTSWEWDFGDGMVSTEQNPCHTYEAAGVYTVALTVTGPCGSDTETKAEYLTVREGVLEAEFTGEPTEGCAPLEVCFTDQSMGDVTSWEWDFGDGGSSTEQNPCHTYEAEGFYTVALTVTGPCGSDTETKVDYVAVAGAVEAEFVGEPTEGIAPLEVCFTDESMGDVTSWEWDFGDGGTSTEQHPCHTYEAEGLYTVALTVTGPCGSGTETKIDYIVVYAEGELNAEFVGEPTEGCARLYVCFTDRSTGEITGWEWDFGDGGVSTVQNPCHKYMNPGMYTVSLTVTGPSGADIETKVNYIEVWRQPYAQFSGEPTEGTAPLEVCFTDGSEGQITSWEWDFGDGGTSTEQNPCHTYAAADTYTVVLTVTGPCGSDSEWKKKYIVVTADGVLDAEFVGEPRDGCEYLKVCFTDQSTGEITGWGWDFGDGGTSTEQNPCHKYMNPGTYTVGLTVTGPSGSDTETKVDYISVYDTVEAEFAGEPTEGFAPLEVCFADQSAGDITSWEWDFGDGGTSTEQNPCHTYETPGTYTVGLTVTGPCGSDTEIKKSYITVSEDQILDAEFMGEPTEGCAPLEVYFTDQSMGDVTSWEWDFGDGGTSTEQHPCHTYEAEGVYTVSLTVTGPSGCDIETKVDYVVVYGVLDAEFVSEPTEGVAPLYVCFADQSIGEITGWEWDFGDGATSTEQNPCHKYREAGTYTVSLTVTGPCGSDTETKADYINVYMTIDVWLEGDSLASPSTFILAQNWPNPFTGRTTITYTLRTDTYVVIEIYEPSGTLVKTVVDEFGTRGTHYAEWDGRAASGAQVPSGAYFYRITAGEYSHVRKMILLR